MVMSLVRNIVPRFRIRTLIALVALSSLGIWGSKLVWEDPSAHWMLLKLRFGNLSTRRAVIRAIERGEIDARTMRAFNCMNSLKTIRLAGQPAELSERPSVEALRFQFWIPSLLLASEEADRKIRLSAIRALKSMARFTTDSAEKREIGVRLFRAVQDSDPEVRAAAVFGLYLFKASEADRLLPTLRVALNDPEMIVRRSAAECLGIIADECSDLRSQAADELARILEGSDRAEVRKAAAWALAFLERHHEQESNPGLEELLRTLVRALSDPCAEIRNYTAQLLRWGLDDPKPDPARWAMRKAITLPAFVAAKTDRDESVRMEVALGLFQFGQRDPWIRTLIEKAAADADETRKSDAKHSLRQWDHELEKAHWKALRP